MGSNLPSLTPSICATDGASCCGARASATVVIPVRTTPAAPAMTRLCRHQRTAVRVRDVVCWNIGVLVLALIIKTRNHGDEYEYCFSDVAHINLLSCVLVNTVVVQICCLSSYFLMDQMVRSVYQYS
jgi:hypothetical protein